jgi:REP element-mobilizing transposase RayT
MPCFLFTYHAHGTWLPDRPEGFVHWRDGLQPTNERLAKSYRAKMTVAEAEFDESLQLLLINELQTAAGFQRFRVHAIATEPTHVHALISWADERSPQILGDGIKESLSRRLTKERAKRKWLAKGGSERRVKDQEHFDYLVKVYLPSHGGWKWEEGRGLYR